MKLDLMVLGAFILYFVFVLGIGYYFYNKSHNMEDYFLGGRQMNPYVTAMSAQASDMSSWLLMGLPGAVLLLGLGEAWIGIGLAIGSYLSWLFVAKKLRIHSEVSGNALTMPEFFSNRFKDNKGYLRMLAAVIILFFFVIYVASGFKGCGVIFTTIFPEIGLEVAMAIGAIIIIAYTFMGGFKAVAWTDFFQAILMVMAIIVVPLATIGNTTGGWDAIEAGLNGLGTEFLNIMYDGGEAMSIIGIISLLAWAFGYFGMPHIVVRYMSIRDPKEVKVARRVSLIWIILALSFAILVGIVGRGYLMIEYGGIPDGFNAEHIFVFLSGDLFPALIAGVLYAAIMAAIMSTADSQLLVASSSITNDIVSKTKWAEKQPKIEIKLMWISRFIVILVAVFAIILALYGGSSIMGLVSYAWAGFGAAFGPLMILSLYWKRMNFHGAIAAMLTGFLTVILWNTFLGSTGIYELLPGFIFAFIAGFVVSLVTKAPEQEIIDEFEKAEAIEKEAL
ncbi:MAG: sodium/proline symporter PutP [Candidatus Methanomethylophilaceae archaeon]|nr:sodium/proline symporter PutP [Candidatus Methanomethylophilaceae archaeon]